ncbi:unnamed protein product [Adineta ricciae]|uniref:F-box domain-containing protein n=1 Tax=Adineta ricciae TaxID=249248 RepID=A0A813S1T8_ADIRI|nr:unnamed protein product [Adineta ricciae]CAF0793547.1 unnamed protein product [Adineta ricciae]
MSSKSISLPLEAIHVILLYCQTPKDYLSQSSISREWFHEARSLKLLMKIRFARKTSILHCRFIQWDFHMRLTVIGHGEHVQRHGLEECVQAYHRVGGPSSEVYYLERNWQEGQLHGLEILREINNVWYTNYRSHSTPTINEMIVHPYDGLTAVDSMRKYGRHVSIPKDFIPSKGCDYLGKIILKRQWILGELKSAETLEEYTDNQIQFSSIYDVLNSLNLSHMSYELYAD